MISGIGFLTQQFRIHSFAPPIPPYPQTSDIFNNQSNVHWEECRGIQDRVILNNIYGTVTDWSLWCLIQ